MSLLGQNLGRVPYGGVPTAEWLNRLAAEVERLGRVSATSPLVASSDPSGIHHAADVGALQALISGTFTGGTVTGDTTFNSTVTFGGNVLQDWTFVSWTGTQNNYALPTGTRYLGVTLTGNATLTGIAGGVEGRALTIVLIDNGGFTLTLSDSSASSSAANRIQLQNLASYVLSEQVQGVELVYASDGATIDNWLLADDRLIIDEDDSSPIVSNTRRLRFEADHFTVTEPSTGTAKVDKRLSSATAYRASGSQTITSSTTTFTALTFTTAVQSGDTYWASGNSSRLTIPATGTYAVGGSVRLTFEVDALASAEEVYFELRIGTGGAFGGTIGCQSHQHIYQPGDSEDICLCVSGQCQLTAGGSGYFELGVIHYNPLGGLSTVDDASLLSDRVNFWIRRLS